MAAGHGPLLYERARDLYIDNDVVVLPPRDERRIPLAGLSLSLGPIEPGHHAGAISRCFREAYSHLAGSLTPGCLWLLACTWGPDNRITRARGLVRALGGPKSFRSSDAIGLTDMVVGDRVYLYGALRLGSDAELGASLAEPNGRNFLAFLPHDVEPNVSALVGSGWERGPSELDELRDLASQIVSQRGVLLRAYGEFDDRRAGVDLIMGLDSFHRVVERIESN